MFFNPLKLRIMKTLKSDPFFTLAFNICNVFQSYTFTIRNFWLFIPNRSLCKDAFDAFAAFFEIQNCEFVIYFFIFFEYFEALPP